VKVLDVNTDDSAFVTSLQVFQSIPLGTEGESFTQFCSSCKIHQLEVMFSSSPHRFNPFSLSRLTPGPSRSRFWVSHFSQVVFTTLSLDSPPKSFFQTASVFPRCLVATHRAILSFSVLFSQNTLPRSWDLVTSRFISRWRPRPHD